MASSQHLIQNIHGVWVTRASAGPCYFAHVTIIHQPSSHASPRGCGPAENSQVLKISTTKHEVSTICCFFRTTDNISLIENLNAWQHFFKCFGTTCKFSVIEKEGLATVFRDYRHLWELGWCEGGEGATRQAQKVPHAYPQVIRCKLVVERCWT